MTILSSSLLHTIPGTEDITRRVLPNGITILVRENPHSQSVVITGSLEVGAVFEPLEKNGLVSFITSALMRGTKNRDFASINEALEGIGASLSVSGGTHVTSFGGKSLSEDLPVLLDVLNDALRYPTFPTEQVERLRGERLTRLKISQQDTRYMAGRAFNRLAYPPEHPYYRNGYGEIDTLSAITLEEMVNFHSHQFGPRGMIIVIVGNVHTDDACAKVQELFGDWENPSQENTPSLPMVTPLPGIVAEDVEIAGKSQSDIILGIAGPSRHAPEYQAARIANHILGVFGMYGRLGKNIREKQGLAYYSYSTLAGGKGPGPWRVIAGVDPADVKKTVSSIRSELERLQNEVVSADELEDSQLNLTGSLPLQLEQNEGVASSIYNMEYYGLGLDYLRHYHETIYSVNAEQIRAVAQKYWSAAFAVVVAGPKRDEAAVDL